MTKYHLLAATPNKPMLVRERATGNIYQAWKVTQGPLPEFLQKMKDEHDLIVSDDRDYSRISPVPFLSETGSTRVGVLHVNPIGTTVWEFADAGEIMVYGTHQFTDHADVETFTPQEFNARFSIYKY